jgi:RNA polymerase sigma factor (sigma-70 family)
VSEVTRILSQIESGDPSAAGQLLPLVYSELRRLASARLAREQPGQTLQPTALVHEAYLRLVGKQEPGARSQEPAVGNEGSVETELAPGSWSLAPGSFDSRGHFFAAAAEAMRRILVENARRKGRVKHGGKVQRVELSESGLAVEPPADELLALDEALAKFEVEEPEKAQLVKLRHFTGMTLEEAATALGISRATASRHWTYARAWLYNAVADR